MRSVSILVVCCLALTTGCLRTNARCGWRFEVLRPPTLVSEALVQESGNSFNVVGQSHSGLRGDFAPPGPFALVQDRPQREIAVEEQERVFFLLQTILQRLESVERSVAPRMPPAKIDAPKSKCTQ